MRHGSLFSGIGGFDLAASWMNWENVFQVEWDKYCQKVLAKNFPNVKRYGDIKEFDGTKYRGLIDILTGGFPCQPFSVAGKQKGKSDDRFLWPEMLRVIREVQPPWITGENVPGIIRMELENICLAMEGEGYEVQPFIIPSASIGSWDKRDRIWIIAYNHSFTIHLSVQQWGQNTTSNTDISREIEINPYIKSPISEQSGETWPRGNRCTDSNSNTISKGLQGYSRHDLSGRQKEQERSTGQANWSRSWIEVASELCGSNARVPNRMDRIKGLGNSVNPYVPYQIFKAIEEFISVNC